MPPNGICSCYVLKIRYNNSHVERPGIRPGQFVFRAPSGEQIGRANFARRRGDLQCSQIHRAKGSAELLSSDIAPGRGYKIQRERKYRACWKRRVSRKSAPVRNCVEHHRKLPRRERETSFCAGIGRRPSRAEGAAPSPPGGNVAGGFQRRSWFQLRAACDADARGPLGRRISDPAHLLGRPRFCAGAEFGGKEQARTCGTVARKR
jgi:hypothetical protein